MCPYKTSFVTFAFEDCSNIFHLFFTLHGVRIFKLQIGERIFTLK